MKENKLKQMIKKSLNLENPVITDITRTPGGETNESYFVTVNNERLVVRVPGAGTDELINRKQEEDNLNFGTKISINPPTLFFDSKRGFKITKKINGANTMTPQLARDQTNMKQIIHLFKHLHTTTEKMKNEFKLFDLLRHYEKLAAEANTVMIEKLTKLKSDVRSLQASYELLGVPYTPCHVDPALENLLISSTGKLYLIDWEYSGRFDPLWDIATLFLTIELQDEEQLFFLKEYLERNPREEEWQRILMHMIFQDYLWCLWAIYKDALGDDVGNDIMMRFERATKHTLLYRKVFEEDIVV